MFFVILFCENCIAESFVDHFDMRKSGTLV